MILSIYITFQIIMVGLFLLAFYTKEEIMWVLTIALSGILMFTSYGIEQFDYVINDTIGQVVPVLTTYSYPYLSAINLLFFGLAVVMCFFDMFEKYRK